MNFIFFIAFFFYLKSGMTDFKIINSGIRQCL
jgi:hypothetical protein